MAHPFFALPRPVVIGHRGAAGTHPENTLASFAAALEQGAQILESDIHVTADGVPVLIHDPEVDRVTEAEGRVLDYPLEALRRLDAGHRFLDERGETSQRGRGHRIPTLEEVFEAFPEAHFNLELKCLEHDVVETTLDLVARYDRSSRTLLAAGEDSVMATLRGALADHATAPATSASLSEILTAIRSALEGTPMPEGVMALQIPATFGEAPLATRELVEHAHAAGVEVHVWTINDLEEIASLLARGVDGIVTDRPGRMHNWLVRDGRR